jgi:putative ABC transport system ATP-binding protein
MTEPLIAARAIHKAYARTVALRGVSLLVEAGEVVAVTGPSGSGKSTLMLCLAGILRPESGEVDYAGSRLDDRDDAVRARLRRRDFGLVLQFGQLLPELDAVDNVSLPLLLGGHSRASAATLSRAWLERLGADEVAEARPGEMSGGQAQRVAIARALVGGPKAIFADEPTAALDSVSGAAVASTLIQVARESGAALLLVTHDNTLAAHADREVVLRDGRNEPQDPAR